VFSLNSVLVSVAISLSEKEPFLKVWRNSYSWQVLTQFALTLLGLALAKLIMLQGWVGLLVFAVPMLVSRGVFQSYVGLREAYADTVRGLVAAIEAKDPYTRGHSERVSEYAVAMAGALSLSGAVRRNRLRGWPFR
jgi:HD-GYP domain-containing protein (c-di-GMP phosphodiesterase class II)